MTVCLQSLTQAAWDKACPDEKNAADPMGRLRMLQSLSVFR